jgi:anti-sigma factor RsiW
MSGSTCIDRTPRVVLAWLDGTLPPDTRAELEAHRAICDQCRRLLANQEIARRAVRSLPLPTVSPAFALRLRQRIAGPPAWLDLANWKALTLGMMPAAALLALALCLPLQRDAAASMTAVLDYWGRGATSDQEMQMLLDPDTDARAVLDSALAVPSR